MALPELTAQGLLPPGIWSASLEEVVTRFCSTDDRSQFAQAVENIAAYAYKSGASRIVFGGSFITSRPDPSDLDVLIVYSTLEQLSQGSRNFAIDAVAVDIVFCAETQTQILSSYVALFSATRSGQPVGVVEISLVNNLALAEIVEYTDEATLDATRWAYMHRHISVPRVQSKVLVTIHGIKSHAAWNAEVTRLASAAGWIVCPFVYGYTGVIDYFSARGRNKVLAGFRDFIFDVKREHGENISLICHSFGTYIVSKYLSGWDASPVKFKLIVLTGSIVHPDEFDVLGENSLGVINEISPRDSVVKLAAATARFVDPLIGCSGTTGFGTNSPKLIQGECQIFDHNNVIRRDVVLQRWLPQLELYARKSA